MAVTSVGSSTSVAAVAATASATSAPTDSTDGFVILQASDRPVTRVRLLVTYSGTVNSCNLRKWVRDGSGSYHRDASTDDLDPLSPGGASPVNETRVFDVATGEQFFIQVSAVAGGGTVAVKLIGAPS